MVRTEIGAGATNGYCHYGRWWVALWSSAAILSTMATRLSSCPLGVKSVHAMDASGDWEAIETTVLVPAPQGMGRQRPMIGCLSSEVLQGACIRYYTSGYTPLRLRVRL